MAYQSKRGDFVVVMVGSDAEHEYVRDFDTLEEAETQATQRNARAADLGIAARYAVRNTAGSEAVA
jgi:hypothetical protein